MAVKVRRNKCQKKLKVESKSSEADLKLNLDSDVKSKMMKDEQESKLQSNTRKDKDDKKQLSEDEEEANMNKQQPKATENLQLSPTAIPQSPIKKQQAYIVAFQPVLQPVVQPAAQPVSSKHLNQEVSFEEAKGTMDKTQKRKSILNNLEQTRHHLRSTSHGMKDESKEQNMQKQLLLNFLVQISYDPAVISYQCRVISQ